MLKEVLLAWLLCDKGGVFDGEAVNHQGIVGLEDYRKEGGEETNKSTAKQSNTTYDMQMGATVYLADAANSWELIKYYLDLFY